MTRISKFGVGAANAVGRMARFAGWFCQWWDRWIMDGLCVNGLATFVRLLSYPSRLLQWGLVQWYALVMVFGLLGFVVYYTWR